MKNKTSIGLNLASMLPWSAIPVIGLPLAASISNRAGYAFWQVLPLRSVSVERLLATGIPIRFAEPAWNATTFRRHFRGELGAEGAPTKLQDPLFFPNPRRCDQLFHQILAGTKARPIYHRLGIARALVEIHPGLDKEVKELYFLAKDNPSVRYVLDLRHLRRMRGGLWGDFRELQFLLPYTELIHVQAYPSDLEWEWFLRGNSCDLQRLLEAAKKEGYNGPFVVEFDPRATGTAGLLPRQLTNNLLRIRERVEEIVF